MFPASAGVIGMLDSSVADDKCVSRKRGGDRDIEN